MNTENVLAAEETNASFLEKLKEWGFQPKALQILAAAKSRGQITTQEIAAILPTRAIKDREFFSSLIAQIGEYLQVSHVGIASGAKERAHKESYPLPRKPKLVLVSSQEKKPVISENRPARRIRKEEDFPMSADPISDEPLSEAEELDTAKQNLLDALSWYLGKVSRFKLLAPYEEAELSRRVQEEGDLEARNTLVSHNLRLVGWVAKRFLWSSMPFEDLIQEGNLGLITAAEKFDYRRGCRFATYATWWVRQAITRGIMDRGGIIRLPVHVQTLRNKVLAAAAEIAGDNHDLPSIEAIAAKLKLPVPMVKRHMNAMRLLEIVSLDSEVPETELTLGESVIDTNMPDPLTVLEAKKELALVCEAVNLVFEVIESSSNPVYSERNVRIFKSLYGFDGSLEQKTLEKAAEGFGVTRERVRQIVERIWERLAEVGVDLDHDKLRRYLWSIQELEKLADTAAVFGTT